MTEGANDRLWAETMSYTCDMSNRCVTNLLDRGKMRYNCGTATRPRSAPCNCLAPWATYA